MKLFLSVAILLAVLAGGKVNAEPSRAGLVVWLDASDPATLVKDAQGRVIKWVDKSGKGHDAVGGAASNPRIIAGGMNGKDVLRFGGRSDYFRIAGPLRAAKGTVTVFIVSRREAAQASQRQWQRLLGSSDGTATPDNKTPNFCITATLGGEGKAYPATADVIEIGDAVLGALTIGASAGSRPGSMLSGDIAELLVYDRNFVAEDEIQRVQSELEQKWGARNGREVAGWTRLGPLPNPPQRTTDAAPLSDQANAAGWTRLDALSDEFEGGALDTAKWIPFSESWKGRQPARFSPANVTVSGGQLHLTMRKEKIPKALEANGYSSYTSAFVHSKTKAFYGYYEVKARPMNSGGSSSFWFSHTGIPKEQTEIDVYEIGGKAVGFERKYNMNAHVFQTAQEKRHWNVGGIWMAPWRLADDFHVYGFEWDEKELRYYVDGVIVRRMANTNWHFPMDLIFDSETMPTWMGMPKDEDLPSTFSVEYVRAWKRGK